jgi:AraC family transcriptional activator FtrA
VHVILALNDHRMPAHPVARRQAVILAFANVVPLDVTGAGQVLGVDLPGMGSPYQVRICGERPGLVATRSGFGLQIYSGPAAVDEADLVVVAGTLPADPDVDSAALDALRAAYTRGTAIVAIGTGAFILARAGLLAGRRATTHWSQADELARRYPTVEVHARLAGVEDGGIFTSAGLSAAVSQCLEIIRRSRGAVVADEVARQAVVTQHAAATGAQPTERPSAVVPIRGLTDVKDWMLHHLDQRTNLDQLAARACMSRRQFTRTFRAEAGVSPWQWLLGQRVRAAKRLLDETNDQVESIARRCGFATSVAFRTTFKQAVGTTPSQYRCRPAP